jgi:hypothetical protein
MAKKGLDAPCPHPFGVGGHEQVPMLDMVWRKVGTVTLRSRLLPMVLGQ